jgi:hypothetical protein
MSDEHLTAEVERLRELINRDRTGLAAGLNAVLKVVEGYRWLAAGEWASYSHEEHTQETLRREIGWAFDALAEIASRHLRQSGLRADAAFQGGPGPAESVGLGNLIRLADDHGVAVDKAVEEFARQLAKLGRDYRHNAESLAVGVTNSQLGLVPVAGGETT